MATLLFLKDVIKRHHIRLTNFQKQGLSKSLVCQIYNHNIWPAGQDHDRIKEGIESVLRESGINEAELTGIWDEEESSENKTKKQNQNIRKSIYKGGPKMLPEVVLQKAGLSKDPFTHEVGDVGDVFDAKPQMFVFQKMVDAAENQKLLGVFGEVGSGKTIIKTVFLEQLKQKRNFIVSEPLINQKERLMPSSIVDGLIQDVLYGSGTIGMNGRLQSPRSLEAKNRFLKYHLSAKRKNGIKTVLIIDEAHDLTLSTVKSLKRLHELQDGFKKLLSIILIGQPEFESLVKDYRVREVTARLDFVRMAPINGMFDDYLKWKIDHAGGKLEEIFTPEAVTGMKRRISTATPLSINVMASHVVYMGWKMDSFPVSEELVEMAWKEMA